MSTENEASQDAEHCAQLIKDNMGYEYCRECYSCTDVNTCDHPSPDLTNCRLLKTLLYKS